MKKLLILLAFAYSGFIGAQDRVFTYTYQSNVLNSGQKEIEVTTTYATGRKLYYKSFEHRLEFEIGLGHNLQTSFYLNTSYEKAITNDNGTEQLTSGSEQSFSNEWKLKLTDPVADFIGSALYFELTLSPSATAYEGKLIFDKQTGSFLHALNLVGEYETENEFNQNGNNIDVASEGELALELNYGFSYKANNYLSLGLEVFNQNAIIESKWENSILSLGPCFSFSGNGFWLNFTCMPQITNLKTGKLELTDHQRFESRLIFSYAF